MLAGIVVITFIFNITLNSFLAMVHIIALHYKIPLLILILKRESKLKTYPNCNIYWSTGSLNK